VASPGFVGRWVDSLFASRSPQAAVAAAKATAREAPVRIEAVPEEPRAVRPGARPGMAPPPVVAGAKPASAVAKPAVAARPEAAAQPERPARVERSVPQGRPEPVGAPGAVERRALVGRGQPAGAASEDHSAVRADAVVSSPAAAAPRVKRAVAGRGRRGAAAEPAPLARAVAR